MHIIKHVWPQKRSKDMWQLCWVNVIKSMKANARRSAPTYKLKMRSSVSVVAGERKMSVRQIRSGKVRHVSVTVKTEKQDESVLNGALEKCGTLLSVNVFVPTKKHVDMENSTVTPVIVRKLQL